MKKRTILLSSLALLLSAALSIGGTAAYFTSKTQPVTNKFTVGGVTIELVEENWNSGKGSVKPGKEVAQNMVPGQTANKDPVVKNIGVSPCYVRLKVSGVTYKNNKISATNDSYTIHGANLGNSQNKWTYSHGYFYYNRTLAGKSGAVIDKTKPLFTSVSLDQNATEGKAADLEMVITAEAVQCEGGLEPDHNFNFIESAKEAFREIS